MNRLAEVIGKGGALGTFVKLPTVETVELMALAGFDLVAIDLEHSPMSLESAANLVAVARGRGLGTLIRIPDHGYSWVQRCLDLGADGLLIPHVDSMEQADRIVQAARFAPDGTRGVGPTTRQGDWGLNPMGDYIASGNQQQLMAQIESQSGVDAAEAMLDDGRFSGLFIGPADLSVALGVQAGAPELQQRIDQLQTLCAGRCPIGIAAGNAAGARKFLDQGFDYVLISNDTTMLGLGAREIVKGTRSH